MDSQMNVFLYGDQSEDVGAVLRSLLLSKDSYDSTIVEAFFHRAYDALRSEISRHLAAYEKEYPRFSSLLDLLTIRSESTCYVAIQHALTTLCHFGLFIQYVEELRARSVGERDRISELINQ